MKEKIDIAQCATRKDGKITIYNDKSCTLDFRLFSSLVHGQHEDLEFVRYWLYDTKEWFRKEERGHFLPPPTGFSSGVMPKI